ncbi:MAG TPA: ATP-binding protein [Chlamydiales bacterium]|nr:ATP-binding protein [Chlamydiales bacterium]
MIEQLLAENEGKTIEFKETARSLGGIMKTVVAFANSAGGVIVIGVKDKTKELVGLSQILSEEERLANAISDSILPLLTPDIEIQSIRDKELLIIRVSHSIGPHYLKSEGPERGVYVRFGSTNRSVDAEMLDSLRLLAKKVSYDELPHPKGKLDAEIMKDVFEWVGKRPTAQALENLGVETVSSGKKYPSNGGVLLFGINRMQLFPDSLVRCARFAGSNREKILDQVDINAPLPLAADLIIAFIERNISKKSQIGRMQREDIPQYPTIAIREAVMNALLHSDYAMIGCHIQIAIFDDRIEFTNPGGLPFGQTIEKALAGSSRIRNRVIARVFRELHLIEQWGSGLRRIVEVCRGRGLKPPLMEELNNQFRLVLYSEQIKEMIVFPWTQKLLEYLKTESAISAKMAMKLWKVSSRTARSRLRQLQEQGIIVRIGTSENDPGASYIAAKRSR